jgi:hypothetical protein
MLERIPLDRSATHHRNNTVAHFLRPKQSTAHGWGGSFAMVAAKQGSSERQFILAAGTRASCREYLKDADSKEEIQSGDYGLIRPPLSIEFQKHAAGGGDGSSVRRTASLAWCRQLRIA